MRATKNGLVIVSKGLVSIQGRVNGKYGIWGIERKPRVFSLEPVLRHKKRTLEDIKRILRSI